MPCRAGACILVGMSLALTSVVLLSFPTYLTALEWTLEKRKDICPHKILAQCSQNLIDKHDIGVLSQLQMCMRAM